MKLIQKCACFVLALALFALPTLVHADDSITGAGSMMMDNMKSSAQSTAQTSAQNKIDSAKASSNKAVSGATGTAGAMKTKAAATTDTSAITGKATNKVDSVFSNNLTGK